MNPTTRNINETVPRHIAMMLPTDSKKKNFLNAVVGKRPDMYRITVDSRLFIQNSAS